MTKNSYWQERFEQIEQAANSKSVKYNRTLEKKYRQAASEIDAQINKWYNRIAKNNNMSISEARRLLTANELKEFKWSVEQYIDYGRQNALDQQWVKELENASAKFHINRLEAMKLEVRHQIEAAMANGQQDMFDMLGDVYKDSFYRSAFELQKGVGIGFDVAKLDDTTVQNVLLKPWAADGSNFSDKLWTNKKKLLNTLDTELSRMVLLGDTPNKAVKAVKEAMDSSLFQAKRLVFTEQAYFATEAQKKAFNSLDVERFEVVSSADRKVCPVCAAKDKQNFPMIEFHIGITAPPFHPLCRCVTAPFFDDEFTSQTRIVKDDNGDKYEIPATMNYGEWKKAFVDGGSKKQFTKAAGSAKIEPKLTDVDIKAINDYLSSKSYIINDKLRNGEAFTDEEKEMVFNLDSALAKMQRYEGNLQRSLEFEFEEDVEVFLSEHAVGNRKTYAEFLSTTKMAGEYNPDGQVQIYIQNAKRGRDISEINENEQEVLYERNTSFVILNRVEQNGKHYILMEEADE